MAGVQWFHSEALAYLPADHRVIQLGRQRTTTPRLAVRWLRRRAGRIAAHLEPPDAEVALRWLNDRHEEEHALSALVRGVSYTFTIVAEATRYLLTVVPEIGQGRHV